MINSKKRDPTPDIENKQNVLRASSITTDTLNYKLNRPGPGLIERDLNGTEKVRSLLGQNQQLRKMYDQEKEKYKQEMAAMLKRTTKLQECIIILENNKIEQDEEIQFLQNKLKENSDKFSVEQNKLYEQIEKYKNTVKELSQISKRAGTVLQFEQKNKELKSEVTRLKQQVNQKQAQNQELVNEIKKIQTRWKSEIKQLNSQIENISSSQISAVEEHEKYVKKSELKIKNLGEEISCKNIKIQELQQKCIDIQEQMEELKIQLEQGVSSITKGKDQQVLRLKSQLLKLKNTNTSSTHELNRLGKQLLQKQTLITQLEEKLHQVYTSQENEKALTQVMNSTWKMQLQAEFKKQKEKVQEKQRQRVLQVEKEIIQLKSKIRMKQEYLIELQQSLAKWQAQFRKAAQSRDIIEAQLMEFKKENLKQHQRLQELSQRQKLNEKQNQLRNLIQKQRLKVAEITKQKQNEKQRLLEALTKVEKVYKEEKKDLEDRLAKSKIQFVQIQKRAKNSQEELERMCQKYEGLLSQKRKLEVSGNHAADIAIKCQKLQEQVAAISKEKYAAEAQALAIAAELKDQKISHEETIEEMEADREQYQKLLLIQSNKCQELQELTKCLKQKLLCYEEECEQLSKSYAKRTKQLEDDQLRMQNMVTRLKAEIEKIQEEARKSKKQVQEVRDIANNKQKEFDRKIRAIQDEKAYLELENQKWKSLRNQSVQEYEEIKRQNRKLKLSMDNLSEFEEKLKQKLGIINELEGKLKQSQQQKIALTEKFERETNQLKSSYEIKIKQINSENELLEDKIKAKISSDFQNAHREEVMRIRRKSEDSSFTINMFEKKVQQLEILIQQMTRSARIEAQGFKKQIEKKQRQILNLATKYDEAKKKSSVILDELDDFSKKYREKELKIQELTQKNKKYQANLSQMSLNLSKSQAIAIKLEQQNKNFQIKNTGLTSEVRKLENQNTKFQYQLEQIQRSLKQIQNQKSFEQEKRKGLQRTIQQLQDEKQRRTKQKQTDQQKRKLLEKKIQKLQQELQRKENQIRFSVKTSQEREAAKTNSRQWQYECQIRKKTEELSVLKSNIEKIESEMRIIKATQKNRKDIYLRLTGISNQHFAIEQRQNQIQFLYTLYEKVKSLTEIMSKLKIDKSIQNQLKVKNEELLKSCSKNLDQNISIKDNYNAVYKKYLKYKEAFIYCKAKLEKCKTEVINDQRYTGEILQHCMTLIPKLQ